MASKVKSVVITIQSIQILPIGNYFLFNEINENVISNRKVVNLLSSLRHIHYYSSGINHNGR